MAFSTFAKFRKWKMKSLEGGKGKEEREREKGRMNQKEKKKQKLELLPAHNKFQGAFNNQGRRIHSYRPNNIEYR